MKRIFPLILLIALTLAGCTGNETVGGQPPQSRPLRNEDFIGKRLAFATGEAFDVMFSENVGAFTPVHCVYEHEAMELVKNGRADALMLDEPMARKWVLLNPEFTLVYPSFAEYGFGAVFGKDNAELRVQFNAFLKEIEANGVHDDMVKRWIDTVDSPPMPDIPLNGANGVLTFASFGELEPFGYIVNGRPEGFDIELARRFAAYMDMDLSISLMTWDALIPYVNAGKADFAASLFIINEEREQFVTFSEPYYTGGAVLVTKKTSETGGDQPPQSGPLRNEDFAGKRVAVQTGTVFEDFFREHVGDAEFLYVNSPLECVEAVKSGRADVTIDDEPILRNYAAKNPGLVIVEPPISVDEYGVIVNKGKPELLAKLNEFYQMITADGTYDDMLARWVDSPVAPPMPNIPEGSGELLRAGVTLLIEPFGYYGAGMEPLGFDVEYLRRFAAWVDMRIEFTDYNFASRIDAVASGRADLCAGLITITEERAKMVNFTEPYYIGGTSLILYDPSAVNAARTFRPDDFTGKTFAILTGTPWDTILEEHIPGAKQAHFNSIPETILSLKQGKVDATFTSTALAKKFGVMYPDLTLLYPPVTESEVALVFGKEHAALRENFNDFLREIRDNGIYQDMTDRWLDTPEPLEMPEIENSATNGKLVFATTGNSDVYSFIQNGKPTGFEVELAYRFAAYMDRELEIQLMDFPALIPAIQSGKAEFAGARFAVTEERKQSVDFSDTILEDGIVVAIRKETAPASPGFWESLKTSVERNLIQEDRWKMIVDGLRVSLIITIFSFALATLLGFGVCGLRMSKNKLLNAIGSVYVTILRGTPIVVLLMITFYVIFAKSSISGTTVAVIAFGANGAAFIGEIIRSAILTIEKGQVEAARSMGFSKVGAFMNVTLPQAVRVAFPTYMSEFVSTFKMTAVVGYIAIVDLTKAGDIIRSRTYDAFFPLIMVALVYLLAASLMIWLFNLINRKTNKRLRRAK